MNWSARQTMPFKTSTEEEEDKKKGDRTFQARVGVTNNIHRMV